MRRFQLDMKLEEELVISARSATVGGNHSLDYIPGATLLGAVAARLYHRLEAIEQSYGLFHSGNVRFGNALPLAENGERGQALPLAWHKVKGADIHQANHPVCLDPGKVTNYCRIPRKPEVKRIQLRAGTGYVTASGYLVTPKTRFRMKTAIDPDKGSAATAQLFGYQSLQAGQCFRAFLDVDDADALGGEQLLDDVFTALSSGLYLGRSRSAQYGEVRCQATEVTAPTVALGPCGADPCELSIWLQSDTALFNEVGQPVLMPSAEHFGLTGELVPEKTFIRIRSYSPYNSKRRHYDSVREVLEQGSVITLRLAQPVAAQDFSHLVRGVGAWREQGLGQISLNSALLTAELPQPEPLARVQHSVNAISDLPLPDHPLARWLAYNISGGSHKQAIRQQAEQAAKELAVLYEAARRFAGQPAGTLVGPGTTQWGRIAEEARRQLNAPTAGTLLAALFDPENKQAVCKPGDEDWFAETGRSGADSSFAGWLQDLLSKRGDKAALLAANLAQIARTVVKTMEGRK